MLGQSFLTDPFPFITMKRLILFLSICFIVGIQVYSQSDKNDYLFSEFQSGSVYYKDGRQFTVALNYHFVGKRFQFIDPVDNQIKDFAEPELVTLLKIGERTFLHDPKDIKEVVCTDPAILVQYRARTKPQGKNAGYGGTSETSAIQSYSGIQKDGKFHPFEQENSMVLTRINKIYHIGIKNKYKQFTNAKSFLKIYPDKKEQLSNYIREHQTDFNSIGQVIQLCLYAEKL